MATNENHDRSTRARARPDTLVDRNRERPASSAGRERLDREAPAGTIATFVRRKHP